MIALHRIVRAAVLGALLAGAMVAPAVAQTLTIGVRAGPESIDPHYTATGTHAEALKEAAMAVTGKPIHI